MRHRKLSSCVRSLRRCVCVCVCVVERLSSFPSNVFSFCNQPLLLVQHLAVTIEPALLMNLKWERMPGICPENIVNSDLGCNAWFRLKRGFRQMWTFDVKTPHFFTHLKIRILSPFNKNLFANKNSFANKRLPFKV